MTLLITCPRCGSSSMLENINLERYNDFKGGRMKVQDAFPGVPDTVREVLLSGLCPGCQEKIFKEE